MRWIQAEQRLRDVRTAAGLQLISGLVSLTLIAGPMWLVGLAVGAFAGGDLGTTLWHIPALWLLPLGALQALLSMVSLSVPGRVARRVVAVVAIVDLASVALGAWHGPTAAVAALGLSRGWHHAPRSRKRLVYG